jgi:hypothetical protein
MSLSSTLRFCNADPGTTVTDIVVENNTGYGDDSATPRKTFSDGSGWHGSGNTRLYFDPGTSILLGVYSAGGYIQQCHDAVSGYSVAIP